MYGEAMLAEKYRLGHFNKMPYININGWEANPRTKNNCLSPGITLIRSKLLIPKNNQQDFKKLLLRMTHWRVSVVIISVSFYYMENLASFIWVIMIS